MPYVGDKPNLECHTARYQLGQARKFLDDMMKPEIFNDDEKFDRALFGFCNAIGTNVPFSSIIIFPLSYLKDVGDADANFTTFFCGKTFDTFSKRYVLPSDVGAKILMCSGSAVAADNPQSKTL